MSNKTKNLYTGDEDFDALIEKGIRIMKTKSVDYAEAGDRLAEIKETARDVGITPRQVLGVYINKHYRSVKKWMRGEELRGEPIEEKLCDIQVYAWIAAKLAAEERKDDAKPVFPTPGTFSDEVMLNKGMTYEIATNILNERENCHRCFGGDCKAPECGQQHVDRDLSGFPVKDTVK